MILTFDPEEGLIVVSTRLRGPTGDTVQDRRKPAGNERRVSYFSPPGVKRALRVVKLAEAMAD